MWFAWPFIIYINGLAAIIVEEGSGGRFRAQSMRFGGRIVLVSKQEEISTWWVCFTNFLAAGTKSAKDMLASWGNAQVSPKHLEKVK